MMYLLYFLCVMFWIMKYFSFCFFEWKNCMHSNNDVGMTKNSNDNNDENGISMKCRNNNSSNKRYVWLFLFVLQEKLKYVQGYWDLFSFCCFTKQINKLYINNSTTKRAFNDIFNGNGTQPLIKRRKVMMKPQFTSNKMIQQIEKRSVAMQDDFKKV